MKKERHAGPSGGKKNWGRFLCSVRTRPLNDPTCHHEHEELDRKRQRKEVCLQRPIAPEFDHWDDLSSVAQETSVNTHCPQIYGKTTRNADNTVIATGRVRVFDNGCLRL